MRPAAASVLARWDGGADSARDIVDFSSRGPTDDGRLKPDLVAPGTHIAGAAPQHAGYNATSVAHGNAERSPWSNVNAYRASAPTTPPAEIAPSTAARRFHFVRTASTIEA
jgi:hypothetical protein